MDEPRYGKTMKSKGGLARLLNALKYTWHGLRAAAKHEQAFKQELIAVLPLSITAWFLPGVPPLEKALLFGVLQLILVVELINSAIEANTDHITMERHPLAKRAKDMGSAAVFLTILVATATWAAVIWTRFF
ncbi:MAG: diacylglycerol kinase [Verrucomicrobia bacterium]|nr:diacylglycerol kinase [Verrucomicrobiota bacterium]